MIYLNSFLGISIISDMFMSAIEKITAKTKQIHIASSDEDGQEVTEVPVWNGTVANLTLMAWVPLPQRSYLLLLVATLSQRGWDPALWWG